MTKNVLIDLNGCKLDFTCGGIMVQFELCRVLCELGVNARIKASKNIKNSVCNSYYNNDFPIDNNCVVIYGETIEGNPLNANNIVRWILGPVGVSSSINISNTWQKDDLVYYFNSEEKFNINPERIGNIYKLLNCHYINPYTKQTNLEERVGVCYTIRKAREMHRNNLRLVHPKGSFEITREHTQMQCIEFFNAHKWFMCYDPLTFYIIISALCGCIPIVYKVAGLTKQQWIQTTTAAEYCKSKGLDNLYGIAYGQEDMEYAKNTIHLVKDQWDDIVKFNKEKTIIPFINDIQDINNMLNTVKNNY
jgi:hypothetical protein